VTLRGDEFHNWLEDAEGFTVIQNNAGEYVYALDKGRRKLEPSDYLVGKSENVLEYLVKGVRPQRNPHMEFAERNRKLVSITEGRLKNLVIPIMFSDHQDRDLPTQSDIELLFNAPGGHPTWAHTANMSVRDYFLYNSYNKLDLNSTVLDWVLVDISEEDVTKGVSAINDADAYEILIQTLHEALDQVDAIIDFQDFDEDGDGYIDAITFMHSGYGAEWGSEDPDGATNEWRVWSHKGLFVEQCLFRGEWYWCYADWESEEGVVVSDYHLESALYGHDSLEIATIATTAHETIHFFGLPDLYDRDGSSGGTGVWCIMASHYGWTNDASFPPHMSAWVKHNLSWIDITYLDYGDNGTYEIAASADTPIAYIIEGNYPSGEYLIIENRQPMGLEIHMPQGGLLIMHIDEHMMGTGNWNDLESYPGSGDEWDDHYAVAVVQADGRFDLEMDENRGDSTDVFHANGTSELLNGLGYPSTNSYLKGNYEDAGIQILDISYSDNLMTFEVAFVFEATYPDDSSEETSEENIDGAPLLSLAIPISFSIIAFLTEYFIVFHII